LALSIAGSAVTETAATTAAVPTTHVDDGSEEDIGVATASLAPSIAGSGLTETVATTAAMPTTHVDDGGARVVDWVGEV
jgi:hypothetical protein